MELVLALVLGVSLSAACGFRVFVLVFVAGLASWSGHLELAEGAQWLGSPAALVALGAATVLEAAAYKVPWLDNLLDTAAVPAAVVAGTLLTASFVADMSPLLRWSAAAVAGGGVAGGVSVTMAAVRGVSTVTTGGLTNPVVSAAETTASVVVSVLAVAAPLLGLMAFAAALAALVLWRRRRATVVAP